MTCSTIAVLPWNSMLEEWVPWGILEVSICWTGWVSMVGWSDIFLSEASLKSWHPVMPAYGHFDTCGRKAVFLPKVTGQISTQSLRSTFENGTAQASLWESLSACHIIAPINIITAGYLKAITCFMKHGCSLWRALFLFSLDLNVLPVVHLHKDFRHWRAVLWFF